MWIIFVDFRSALVTQIPYLIFLYCGNLSCSDIVCLKLIFLKVLYLWCIIQIAFQKYKMFWILLVDFNLTLLNLRPNSVPETHLQIQAAPRIEVAICFFYEAPCTQQFYCVKCSKSFLLGRIWNRYSDLLKLVDYNNVWR